MIEALAIAGGLGLAFMVFGGRRRRKRIVTPPPDGPRVIIDPPPPRDGDAPAPAYGVADVAFEPDEIEIVDVQRNVVVDVPRTSRLERLAELIAQNVRNEPSFGYFYPIKTGDTLPGIVKRLFDTIGGASVEQRLHYIHCLSSGHYNAGRYGTPSTSKRFGKDLCVPGNGIGLRVAFLPRNEDALAAMARGRMPQMTVDPKTGEPIGLDAHLGVLWLLPVDEQGVRAGELPSCSAYSYHDGSSTIDPPPELLELLEAA